MIELLPTILAATEGHQEATGGISALGLDPLAILAQGATFLVLFYVVKRFALEKIVQTLEHRRKTIDKGVRLGLEMQAEQTKLEETIEQKLHEVRLQADTILTEAHQEAGTIVKQAEASAAERVETILGDAQARIQDDIQKAKRELEKEMIGLVADATEIIIGQKLDTKRDNAVIEQALAGAKK